VLSVSCQLALDWMVDFAPSQNFFPFDCYLSRTTTTPTFAAVPVAALGLDWRVSVYCGNHFVRACSNELVHAQCAAIHVESHVCEVSACGDACLPSLHRRPKLDSSFPVVLGPWRIGIAFVQVRGRSVRCL
jgi:hypothetical protein